MKRVSGRGAPQKVKQPSREELIAMMNGGLARALQEVTALYVMPLCFVHAEQGKPAISDNGSAFMVDCGDVPYLVTANHVYEGYQRARALRQDTVALAWLTKFPLHDRLIAADSAHDLATFRVTPAEIAAFKRTGKEPLKGISGKWPPIIPQEGRGMFFSGFPVDGRTLLPYRGSGVVETDWHAYTALTIATSVSATGITLVMEHDPRWTSNMRPTAPPEWALGGCSGAPLLSFIENRGIFGWELGGVIYECGNELFKKDNHDKPKGEYFVKASRADCLNPDGSINRHPDPAAYRARG